MNTTTPRKSPGAPGREDAVGIVVHNGRLADERPRAVAFVWGQAVHAAPSLPFGRWKGAVRPAA
jgi:hypothetical protein